MKTLFVVLAIALATGCMLTQPASSHRTGDIGVWCVASDSGDTWQQGRYLYKEDGDYVLETKDGWKMHVPSNKLIWK